MSYAYAFHQQETTLMPKTSLKSASNSQAKPKAQTKLKTKLITKLKTKSNLNPAFVKGLKTRNAVLGKEYVQAAFDRSTEFTAPLQELVTVHAWGNTWQRDGLSLKTRSIVTVSMLVALGKMNELKIHVRGALNNGVTKEELQEIFMHASVYCGFPATLDAFKAGSEVIDAKTN